MPADVKQLRLQVDSSGAQAGARAAAGSFDSLRRRTMMLKGAIVAMGGALTALAFRAAVREAMAWETALTGVAKTVDVTATELEALGDELRAMSEEIPVAANELAGIAEAAGQLGIQTANIVDFTRVMADLGVTTNMTANEAATGLARFGNVMQSSQQDFDRMGAAIVDLGNNAATTEAEILAFGTRMAGAGKIAGLAESDVLAIGAAMSSVGVEAEAGGTAVQKVLIDINTAVAQGNEDLGVFAATAGMTADTFEERWRTDAAGAFTEFVEGLGRAGDNATTVLEQLGLNNQRLVRSFLSLGNAGDELRSNIERASEAWEQNTALTEEAERFYETLSNRVQLLKNSLTGLLVSLGDILIEATDAGTVIDGLATDVSTFRQNIDASADVLVAWARVAVASIDAVTAPFRTLIRLSFNLGQVIGDVFSALGHVMAGNISEADAAIDRARGNIADMGDALNDNKDAWGGLLDAAADAQIALDNTSAAADATAAASSDVATAAADAADGVQQVADAAETATAWLTRMLEKYDALVSAPSISMADTMGVGSLYTDPQSAGGVSSVLPDPGELPDAAAREWEIAARDIENVMLQSYEAITEGGLEDFARLARQVVGLFERAGDDISQNLKGALAGAAIGTGIGTATGDPALGMLGGAVGGFATGGPVGAVVGAAAGLASGLLEQGRRAEQAEAMWRQATAGVVSAIEAIDAIAGTSGPWDTIESNLARVSEQLRGLGYEVDFGDSLTEVRANIDALRQAMVDAGYASFDMWQALEGLETALESAVDRIRTEFTRDLNVRFAEATGDEARAEQLRLLYEQAAEMADAVQMFNQGLITEDQLRRLSDLQQLERDRLETLQAEAEALEEQRRMRTARDFRLEMGIMGAELSGEDRTAFRLQQMLQTAQALDQAADLLAEGIITQSDYDEYRTLVLQRSTRALEDFDQALQDARNSLEASVQVALLEAQGQDQQAAILRAQQQAQRWVDQWIEQGGSMGDDFIDSVNQWLDATVSNIEDRFGGGSGAAAMSAGRDRVREEVVRRVRGVSETTATSLVDVGRTQVAVLHQIERNTRGSGGGVTISGDVYIRDDDDLYALANRVGMVIGSQVQQSGRADGDADL